MFTDCQFIKPLPALERSELMIRRRANCAPQSGSQSEHRLDASSKSPADDRRFEPESRFVQSPHFETRFTGKIANRDLRATVGHRHQAFAGKASRLSQIGELRLVTARSRLRRAGKL